MQCQCQLATSRYPCWATHALQISQGTRDEGFGTLRWFLHDDWSCHFEETFSYGCYMQAAGGCPTPTRICSNFFQTTPRPGPHPYKLEPNPSVVISFPALTGASTANFTLTVLLSADITLSTISR